MTPGDDEVDRNPGPGARSCGRRSGCERPRQADMTAKPSSTRSRRTFGTTRSSARSIASASARCGARSPSASSSCSCCCSAAWQHFELLRHGYRSSRCSRSAPTEDEINRHLRLEIETLRSPERIEQLATERLHMVAPAPGDAIVIERVIPAPAAAAVGRRARDSDGTGASRVADTARPTTGARRSSAARRAPPRSCCCGRCAIEARLVYLQVFQLRRARRARRAAAVAHDRRAGQARRDPRSRRPHPRLQRRRRHDLRRSDRDRATPTARGRAVRRARRLHGEGAPGAGRAAVARRGTSRTSAGRCRRIRRGASPRCKLDGIGFMKESKRFYPNKELARARCSATSASTTSVSSGIEATYDKLIRGKPGTVLVQTDARRHAFSRVERPPTAGALARADHRQYLQHVAERELRAGVDERRRRRHRS